MSILVNTHNEGEEKLLIAFLNSHRFDYKSEISGEGKDDIEAFLDQYNREIEEADAEIDSGDYVNHEDVEKLLNNRRHNLNDNKME